MILNRYEIFLKTAEIGNITKTAEILHYTQAGISHAIAALEKETGFSLLARSASGVTLTENGKRLLPYIQTLVNDQHGLSQAIYDINETVAGTLRIATFTSVSTQWLPTIIRKFQADYPLVEFDLLAGDYDEITERILSGRVDCGFLRLPSVKRLQTYALHRDELQVIVPCDHPYADRDPFPVSALAEEPFIQLEEGDDYEITAALDRMDVRPNVRYTAREDRTMLAMVSKGLGISLLPELMVRHSPYPVAVCHAPERFYRNIGIGVKDKGALSASTRRFVDYVRRWVAENGEK